MSSLLHLILFSSMLLRSISHKKITAFAVPSASPLVDLVSRNGKPAIANDAWCELERIVGLDRLRDRHVNVGLNCGRMCVGLDRTWRIIAPYSVSRSRVDELGNDHCCVPDAFTCSAETRHNLSHTPANAVICAPPQSAPSLPRPPASPCPSSRGRCGSPRRGQRRAPGGV